MQGGPQIPPPRSGTGRIRVREAVAVVAGIDPVLSDLARRHGLPRLPRTPAPDRFATLARAIVFQQLAGTAAAAIHGRMVHHLGGVVTAETVLASDLDGLMACGLSRAKARSVFDLADKVASGQVCLERIGRLDDDEVVAHLTEVRGIGRWTAEMFLLFTLGRPDVWPLDDYGVRVGFATAWSLPAAPTPRELDELGERFRPYRSVVAWYCWRAAESRPRAARPPVQAASKATGRAVGDRKTRPRM